MTELPDDRRMTELPDDRRMTELPGDRPMPELPRDVPRDDLPATGEGEPHWLRAGAVGRPHGLDGSFHVAAPVAGLLAAIDEGVAVRVGGEQRRVERLAGHERRPIMRVEGCADRNGADALRGQEILVARAAAPQLEADEWWAADLEGLTVRDGERPVGVVTRMLELPSCEVLEVARAEGGPALLVPLIKDAVRDVDLDAGSVDIDLRFLGET